MHPHDSHAWQRPENSTTSASSGSASASLVDPEDDMPSATYGGDFETTTIPHYNAPQFASAETADPTAFGLVGDQQPLPYAPPGADQHAPAPAEIGADPFLEDRVRAAGRRGTQHLGLFVLRAVVGVILLAHGLQKVFGLWGGGGLDGFQQRLSSMGFEYAGVLTYLAAGAQIAAGAMLILGLFTPLAAAAALAYLVNSLLANVAAQHDAGYVGFFLPDGNEYRILLIGALVAVILAGPGRYGLDAGRGWANRPFIGSTMALLVGVGAGVGAWLLFNGANPLS